MPRFGCRAGLLGLAALLLLAPLAPAQRRTLYAPSPAARPQILPYRVNPNQAGYLAFNNTPQQQLYQARMAGRAQANLLAPSLYAATPYVGGYANYNLVTPAVATGGYYGGYYDYGGYGYPYPYQSQAGSTLQGLAGYTQAAGQYQIQTQQASQLREQRRQMAIDTERKRLQFELDYEKIRPTAPKLLAQQEATDLDWARNHAQNSEIWSGRTLNVLLKSILKSSSPSRGPYISLDEAQLRGLNLTDGTTRGNLGLAKDQGKIAWTEALQEEAFDGARDSFGKTFDAAIKTVESGEQPPAQMVRSLRADLKKLEDKLDDQVRDLPPSRYIESRRLLNQLKDTIKGLSDARVCKSCRSGWKKEVRSVADLVEYCSKNGLEFGPAVAPGDETSYTSAYYALRSYERGVTGVARK